MNIFNIFKKEIGVYCANCQFIELMTRGFYCDHHEIIYNTDELKKYAHEHNLTLTCYDNVGIENYISLNYIVNIHLTFESFLHKMSYLLKDYSKEIYIEKKEEMSYLEHIVKNLKLGNCDKEKLYHLCEYYRLVRNSAVHGDDKTKEKERNIKFKTLEKYTNDFKLDAKFKRLNAPKSYREIDFDDFIMYARASIELANFLFYSVNIDFNKIVNKRIKQDNKFLSKLKLYRKDVPKTLDRLKKRVKQYIVVNFYEYNGLQNDIDNYNWDSL